MLTRALILRFNDALFTDRQHPINQVLPVPLRLLETFDLFGDFDFSHHLFAFFGGFENAFILTIVQFQIQVDWSLALVGVIGGLVQRCFILKHDLSPFPAYPAIVISSTTFTWSMVFQADSPEVD